MTELIIKSFGMYGLTIVISMLAALLIKAIVLSIAKTEDRRKQASKMKRATVAAQKPVLSGQVDPAHVAAISAAVYAMLGSHRIVHIADGRRTATWTSEGKRQLQSSHDVHRTK